MRLAAVRVAFQVDALVLRHSRSMNTLSIQRPHPSIEMRMPAAISVPVKTAPAALVCVEDVWLAEASQCLLQRRDAERTVHAIGQPPG